MGKMKIGFKDWPFDKGERTTLIKISKPFCEDGKWFLDAVYLSGVTNKTKMLRHFFGDLHLLIVGAVYTDGERQKSDGWVTVDIDISKESPLTRTPVPVLCTDKISDRFDYYTFRLVQGRKTYIVPLREILRSILAMDIFWLNQVTMLDSIDTRFVYEIKDDALFLQFLSGVPVKYVQLDQKIQHMAWILTNPEVFAMINETHQSIISRQGIKFDFLFDELHLKARAEQFGGKYYIKEIVKCTGKKINCANTIVFHPSLAEYEKKTGEKEKQWTSMSKGNAGTELEGDKTSTPGMLDVEKENQFVDEYSSVVEITRMKVKRTGGSRTTSQTKPVDNKKNSRTTGDFGGSETVPQIEFEQTISEKPEGPFAVILEILKLMIQDENIASVGYHIGLLKSYFIKRAICTLDDKITPRRYLVARIRGASGKEAMIIEIEKQKNLSTLMLVSYEAQNWDSVCNKVVKGLILKSGTWPDFGILNIKNVEINRLKHTNAEIDNKVKRIVKLL